MFQRISFYNEFTNCSTQSAPDFNENYLILIPEKQRKKLESMGLINCERYETKVLRVLKTGDQFYVNRVSVSK